MIFFLSEEVLDSLRPCCWAAVLYVDCFHYVCLCQVYTVVVTRELLSMAVTFTDGKQQLDYECPVSLSAFYRPVSINHRWDLNRKIYVKVLAVVVRASTPFVIFTWADSFSVLSILQLMRFNFQWPKARLLKALSWDADPTVKSRPTQWLSSGRWLESRWTRPWQEDVRCSGQVLLYLPRLESELCLIQLRWTSW